MMNIVRKIVDTLGKEKPSMEDVENVQCAPISRDVTNMIVNRFLDYYVAYNPEPEILAFPTCCKADSRKIGSKRIL